MSYSKLPHYFVNRCALIVVLLATTAAAQAQSPSISGPTFRVDGASPNYVVALEIDHTGKAWVGTWGAGLSIWDGNKFTTLTKKDGLPSNHVFMLFEDSKQRMWIGTSHGLARQEKDGSYRYFTTGPKIPGTTMGLGSKKKKIFPYTVRIVGSMKREVVFSLASRTAT